MGVEAPIDYDVADGERRRSPARTAPLGGAGRRGAARRAPSRVAAIDQLRAQELANKSAARPLLARARPPAHGLTYNGHELDRLVWNFSGGLALCLAALRGRRDARDACARATRTSAALRAQIDSAAAAGARRRRAGAAGDRAPPRRRSPPPTARSPTRASGCDLAEGRYRTGVGSIIELGDAQLAATTAAFQKLQAQLKLDTARAQLTKALAR